MRVIAGTLGGRRLVAPAGVQTRPTSDRVREALFSALGTLTDAHVLDAYAGTGALAIEALSRGAAHAVLVERDRPALKALRQNLTDLNLTARATVLACPVERAAKKLAEAAPFDVIFADPPYASLESTAMVLATWVRSPSILAPDGTLVIEHAAHDDPPKLSGMHVVRTRCYGDTAVTFLVFLAI